jgi:hypothetical protein
LINYILTGVKREGGEKWQTVGKKRGRPGKWAKIAG